MDVDDLKDRYKAGPLYLRILLTSFLGTFIGFYIYMDEGEGYEIDLQAATEERERAKIKFEKMQKRKENLPKLEEQLAFTEEQLEKAKTKMPDTIHMEDILQKVATVAKELDLQMREFDPQNETIKEGDFRYAEVPIKIRLFGKYFQIVSFFDRVTHLQKLIHIRNVILKSELAQEAPNVAAAAPGRGQLPPEQEANQMRDLVRVSGLAELVVYRGLKQNEAFQPAAADPNAPPPDGGNAAPPAAGDNPPAAGEAG